MPAETPVRLADVRKTFAVGRGRRRDERAVLDGISLEVRAGEFVSVIGPSGCGKSTLFNLVSGLERPTGGTVETAERPAYMPQRDLLFPWRTIAENAALGLDVAGVPRAEGRRRVRALLPEFGLAGFEDAYPFELSGGMRQRAAFVRTVAAGSGTLLLDEPFGALDALTRFELQTWLQRVWAAHAWTAMLITHDVREAILLSDRVVVLSPRPATVQRVIEVDLPRPRGVETLALPEFARLEQELLEALHAA